MFRYLGIIVEEFLGMNKAAIALLMAVSLWTIRATGPAAQARVWVLVCVRVEGGGEGGDAHIH